MAGKDNLRPPRSTEEARERGRKGGKASGVARRERKALKDELLALLSDGDTQEKMCMALIMQARRGNIKAFEVVRDTIGENPVNAPQEQSNPPDDGFIAALNAAGSEVFADGVDEPADV